jgi:pSer/pThr/pTyr-binding forkhead associated (FHA) protein
MQQGVSFANPEEYDARFADLLAALNIDTTAPAPSEALPAVMPIIPAMPSDAPAAAPASAPVGAPVGAPADPASGETGGVTGGGTMARASGTDLLLLSIDSLWPPERVSIHGSVVTIGRESGNDVLLADPAVSRFHLRLVRQGAGWWAELAPNAKPFYVNGERREMALVGQGDQLVLGGTALRLEPPATAPRTALARSNATTLRANVATLQGLDARTVLASGLVPELHIETPRVHFSVPLRAETVTIGRAPESALVIPSPLIASHQAVVRSLVGGGYEIEPLRAARNTFTLEGRTLKRRTLQPGDALMLGSRLHNQYVTVTYASAADLPPSRA